MSLRGLRGAPAGRYRGQSLVEFALVLPLLLVILVGLFDFGRAVYAHHTIQNATRQATRLAIVDQALASIRAEAAERAVGLKIDPADVVVAIKEEGPNADARLNADCAPPRYTCVAVVTVTHGYTPATPIISAIIGPITLSATSQMGIERVYTSP